jgi:hypothetical protein
MKLHLVALRGVKHLAVLGKNRKADFVIAGAQKAGTSALASYLNEHPEIGLADCKEVHFFDREKYFHRCKPPYSLYLSHFSNVLSRKCIGEATPSYLYWRPVPQRLRDYNPSLKIIAILRNPIDRAYSHWNMEREKKVELLSFGDALNAELTRAREAHPNQHRCAYIYRGFYAEQLERLWTCFPKSQTLILRNENLRNNPLLMMNEICRFLDVRPFEKIIPREEHSRQYIAPMNPKEREFLKTLFAPDIKKLETLLGWDCSDWL